MFNYVGLNLSLSQCHFTDSLKVTGRRIEFLWCYRKHLLPLTRALKVKGNTFWLHDFVQFSGSNTRLQGFPQTKDVILNPSASLGLVKASTIFPRQKNPQDLACLLPVYPSKMLLPIQLPKKISLLELCWATSSSCNIWKLYLNNMFKLKNYGSFWFCRLHVDAVMFHFSI